MPVIDFQLLLIPDAEDAVVETWSVLEEYGIPSPDIMFMFRGSSRVKIALRVDNPVDAQTLMLRLASLGAVVDQRHALVQPMRCPHVLRSSAAPSPFLRSSHNRHRRPHTAIRLFLAAGSFGSAAIALGELFV